MEKVHSIVFVLFVFAPLGKTDYVAAVVEYQPDRSNTSMEENVVCYCAIIFEAHFSYHAKIIVFPEYGLTGMVDDPTDYALEVPEVGVTVTLGGKYSQLFDLAQAAWAGIYVVVNLLEKAQNGANETVYYNTNVVFDPTGTVVAKYRKVNLYNESMLTPGNQSENQAIFETDFGVTFGLFTGFDMLSYNPSRSILINSSVTDILLPSAWFSTLPFFHSLSFQSGYAMTNKVNLLVATNHDFQEGIGGSGIYGSNGTVYSYFISESVEINNGKILYSTVGDLENGSNARESLFTNQNNHKPTRFQPRRYFDSDHYSFKTLNLTHEKISEEICDGSFCCSFNIVLSPDVNTSEIYKLMAQHGQYRLGEYKQNNVRICSLLACQNSNPSTCGFSNVSITSQFKSISVKTSVDDDVEYFYQPISLTTDLLPVFNTTYSSTTANETRSIVFSTNKVEEKVLVFGIYGNSGITVGASITLLVAVMASKYLY